MKKIKLKIATPERVVLEEEVNQASLPTEKGEITILPKHISLLTVITPGIVEAKNDGHNFSMAISGGFLELHNDELTVLADTAERAEEIDLERAEEARARAEKLKQEERKSLDEEQYAMVISRIEKQLARIKVAKKYRLRTKEGMQLGNNK